MKLSKIKKKYKKTIKKSHRCKTVPGYIEVVVVPLVADDPAPRFQGAATREVHRQLLLRRLGQVVLRLAEPAEHLWASGNKVFLKNA